MITEPIVPDFNFSDWVLVCGFISTAFFSQLSRQKSSMLKVLEVIALIAGSCFTLVNAIWFFALAVILFNLALFLRLTLKLDARPSETASPPAQGAIGS